MKVVLMCPYDFDVALCDVTVIKCGSLPLTGSPPLNYCIYCASPVYTTTFNLG